ncbi:hypothetical protein ACJMK2_023320 [Sinanodonta woodiana]|uniref:Secernin-3 n=1 Tax=Sinanodonta woodiana TaxID=1069815 RepID=A0ABD3T402_SINWO
MASHCKSCDTFVALPPATAKNCVIFGKNSDRPADEVQEVIYQAEADHEPNTKVQCTYIDIDQVPHTHAVILSKPSWMWGAEMGANDQGVCIGNEAVWTKVNSDEDLQEKLLGMDLVRLGLERGSTAREALDVITSLLSLHGQGGTCSEGGAWAYHNSYLIADKMEAWVLETAQQFWAAERITAGVRNISNELSITEKIDLMSPNLMEKAKELGLYKESDGPFNFAKVFSEHYVDPKLSESSGSRYGRGRKMLKDLSKEGVFHLKNMMEILRDEDSGICMTGDTGFASVGSQVSVLSPTGSSFPDCHWFTATPNPRISLFKPFIFCPGPNLGSMTMSPDFGIKEPRKIKPRFQTVVDRRHDLYKGHQKLQSLQGTNNSKGLKMLKDVQDLEEKCIADVEQILDSFNQQSLLQVSGLFKHICDIEFNFYKGCAL